MADFAALESCNSWFYANNGAQEGPISLNELVVALQNGSITVQQQVNPWHVYHKHHHLLVLILLSHFLYPLEHTHTLSSGMVRTPPTMASCV